MGCDGVGNALNVNRTLEVGGSTPLGSTYDPAGLVLSQLSHACPYSDYSPPSLRVPPASVTTVADSPL